MHGMYPTHAPGLHTTKNGLQTASEWLSHGRVSILIDAGQHGCWAAVVVCEAGKGVQLSPGRDSVCDRRACEATVAMHAAVSYWLSA